jgi:hypothetical protein
MGIPRSVPTKLEVATPYPPRAGAGQAAGRRDTRKALGSARSPSRPKALRLFTGTGSAAGRYTAVRIRPIIKGAFSMLAGLAVLLVVLWLLGFLVVHVGGALIHILLVVAVIVLVLHFIRGRA